MSDKYVTYFRMRNKCGQEVTVTDCDSVSSTTVLLVRDGNKEEFRLYFSSNEEIDILIEMLQRIKD